jgi:hypothetical protein
MAEKFSVLIKYKYLEYAENAKLSDADSWRLMKGIIEYDRYGEDPVFENPILTALFAVIKTDLDSNREKWEETAKARREAGKKGMDNRWGKPKEAITEITDVIGVTENITKITKITDSDLDSDLGSGNEIDSGGGSGSEPVPPPPLEKIKNESKTQGFIIDSAIARQFQNAGLDPSWFTAPHSFLEFSAARVKKKYPAKDADGLKSIFIAAVKSWEDLREAYPLWRTGQEKRAKDAEKHRAAQKARDDAPKKCRCGGDLNDRLYCGSCTGQYAFDDETLEYVFIPPREESLFEGFERTVKERYGKGGGP